MRLIALLLLLAAPAGADDGILIFGATGRSGSEIAKILVNRGETVTAFVRPSSNRSRLDGMPVRFVEGDVLNPDDVAAAFKGKRYRVVIETLQERRGEPSPYVPALKNLTPWAKATGVSQVVIMSATGADHAPQDFPQINWAAFGETLKNQTEAEHILRDSGVGYTIIRIGAIISERGKPPHPPTGKSYLTEDLSKYAAVAYGDLIAQTAACVGAARCMNKIFVIADDTLAGELPHFICRRFAKNPDKECS
jgi:uncharacterized protein YbjT (DUF2867 family)